MWNRSLETYLEHCILFLKYYSQKDKQNDQSQAIKEPRRDCLTEET